MLEEALRRGWTNLIGRSDGPMDFRLILQPAVAIFIAIRAGLKDARNGEPPFLSTVLLKRDRRRELLRQGWRDVGRVFIVALILDAIYQIVMHSSIFPLEMLMTAMVLALLPYALLRGVVTRLARRQPGASSDGESPGIPGNGKDDATAESQRD